MCAPDDAPTHSLGPVKVLLASLTPLSLYGRMELLVHLTPQPPRLHEHALHVQPVTQLLLLLHHLHDPEGGGGVLLRLCCQLVQLPQGSQQVPELCLLR